MARVGCRRAWSTRSSWASGCSIISEIVGVELAQEIRRRPACRPRWRRRRAAIRGCRRRISPTTDDVGARLDLELDAAVAEAEEAPHPLVQGVHGGLDAQAHPHLDPVAHASDDAGDGLAAQPGHQVHEGQLDSRLGHGVAPEGAEARSEVGQVCDLLAEDRGGQVVADDVARRAHRLVAEEGGLPGHAFAPSGMRARLEAEQEEEPRRPCARSSPRRARAGAGARGAAPGRPGAAGRRARRCNIRCGLSGGHEADTISHPGRHSSAPVGRAQQTLKAGLCRGRRWGKPVYFSRIHTIDSDGGGSGRGVPGAGGGPGAGCGAGGWRLYRMGFGIAVIGAPLANVPLMTLTPPSRSARHSLTRGAPGGSTPVMSWSTFSTS